MSLILSGTDGLSEVDGTAATPAIRGTDANTGIFFPAADTIAFSEGGVESMRIDSSGNLGIGTSSPTTRLTVVGTTTINTATDATAGLVVKTFSAAGGIQPIANFQRSDAAVSTQIGYNGTTGDCFFGTTSNHNLYFISNNTERVRIDTSGNVGVGTTSPSSRLHVAATASTIGQSRIEGSGVGALFSGMTAGSIGFLHSNTGTLAFGTSTSDNNLVERARIDSSGNLLVGTTTAGAGAGFPTRLAIDAGAGDPSIFKTSSATNGIPLRAWNSDTTGDNIFVNFATETSYTSRGSITYNRTGGLIAYGTTSDYRAKDINGHVNDSGVLIDSVPVYMGKMKWAEQERPMFIAHETPTYAHTGEKDAVDKDGKPVYQQMDASALIPVMWAEIQSLRKRLAAAGI